jgi:hypothetical protein
VVVIWIDLLFPFLPLLTELSECDILHELDSSMVLSTWGFPKNLDFSRIDNLIAQKKTYSDYSRC